MCISCSSSARLNYLRLYLTLLCSLLFFLLCRRSRWLEKPFHTWAIKDVWWGLWKANEGCQHTIQKSHLMDLGFCKWMQVCKPETDELTLCSTCDTSQKPEQQIHTYTFIRLLVNTAFVKPGKLQVCQRGRQWQVSVPTEVCRDFTALTVDKKNHPGL